jgi:hypothetical protein
MNGGNRSGLFTAGRDKPFLIFAIQDYRDDAAEE